MNKKILFILPKFEFGGTVFSTLNMISMLSQYYDIKVLPMVSYGPVKNTYSGVTLLDSNKIIEAVFIRRNEIENNCLLICFIKLLNRIFNFLGISLLRFIYPIIARRLMRENKFDFVVSCQEGDSTEFLSYFSGVKKIAWFRSEYSVYRTRHTQKFEHRLHKIYSCIDNVVCVSKITRDDFVNWFPEMQHKTIAIHNIQNIDKIIQQSRDKEDIIDKECFSIISVGRFAPQKRFSSIPQIANQLIQKGCRFKWYIIGDGNIEGEMDRFNSQQYTYATNDYVISLGSRVNPYPYIANANLLVITSSYEACPRVVAEAQILNTPVISSDFSSAKEFVNDRTYGIVDTLENLYLHIARYINDRDYYEDIYKKCQNVPFANTEVLEQLLNLFQNVN